MQRKHSTVIERLEARIRRLLSRTVLGRSDMHRYQVMAVDFIKETPFCALFIDLGLGKTIIALTAAVDLWMRGSIRQILVVAPIKVAKQTWPNELREWSHVCNVRMSVIVGDEKTRLRAIRSTAPIHIVNREAIPWLADQFGSKWPYDMVIIDESSSVKDHKTKRFDVLKNVRPYMKRLVEMTASPLSESYEYLFAQTYLLDQGKRFGRFHTKFMKKYFNVNRWSYKAELREDMEDVMVRLISDISLDMRAEDYLDRAKPVMIPRYVDLSDKQMDMYNEMRRNMVIDVIDDIGDTVTIEAETAAALGSKLLQMASGVIYQTVKFLGPDGEPRRRTEVHQLHSEKLDELEKLVESLEGRPLVVAYWFKSSLENLKKRFPKAVVMDKEGSQVPAWNKGKIKLLFIHPASAGHGLNMQHGGHNLSFYDLPASYELFEQTIGRLNRQGQEHIVRVWPILARRTDDIKAFERLQKKKDTQDYFYSLLKRYTALKKKRLLESAEEL